MSASQTFTDQVFSMLEERGQAALNAQDPISAMHELMQGCFDTLGDRTAHLKPGALLAGEHQYFVAGAFFVTPDRRYHMIFKHWLLLLAWQRQYGWRKVALNGSRPTTHQKTGSMLTVKASKTKGHVLSEVFGDRFTRCDPRAVGLLTALFGIR